MHPDTRIPHVFYAQTGASYAEVVAQRDRAQGEADATHAQLVTMIAHVRNSETGWKLIVLGAVAVGFVFGAISHQLAVILVGSVAP